MDITLSTTAAQDAILERLRVKTNEERALQELPALADIPALVRSILVSAVQSYRQQQTAEDIAAIAAAYEAAGASKRAEILSASGV
jgi:hypothetical protein